MKRETTLMIVAMLSLVITGMLMVYSIGAIRDPRALLMYKHLVFLVAGLAAFLFMSRFDYHQLGAYPVLQGIVLFTFILLSLTFVPGIRLTMGGASRWIGWRSISFQPSELAKFALILLLAVRLSQHQEKIKGMFTGFLMPFGIAGLFAGVVVAQRDIGIPFVMLATTAFMVWTAGGRKRYLIGSAILGCVAMTPLVMMKGYRFERILAFLDPWSFRQETGYQLIQSMSAFAQGGLLGRGPGAGEQKLGYLPAAHTDFIYAMVGEELGFLGSCFVLFMFIAIFYAAIRIAMNAPALFGALLAVGIGTILMFQALFIMGVTLGLLPTKGLPLPFVSYGGSAMIVSLFMMGVLVNIGAQSWLQALKTKPSKAKKRYRDNTRRTGLNQRPQSVVAHNTAFIQ